MMATQLPRPNTTSEQGWAMQDMVKHNDAMSTVGHDGVPDDICKLHFLQQAFAESERTLNGKYAVLHRQMNDKDQLDLRKSHIAWLAKCSATSISREGDDVCASLGLAAQENSTRAAQLERWLNNYTHVGMAIKPRFGTLHQQARQYRL